MYGILIIFGLFILLLVTNPNLSCFGKRIKSPFYPLFRKKKAKRLYKQESSWVGRTEEKKGQALMEKDGQKKKTDDYGFHLD
jgi:hypothetical protein